MTNAPTFDPSDVRPWEYLDPPMFWEAIDDYVIADRHLPDGTRQHMVRGHVPPGMVVRNAQIIGEGDSQRPFWTTFDDSPDSNPWPVRDLAEWLRVTELRPGFACQVIWRERPFSSVRHHTALTTQDAAAFARSLVRDLGSNLYGLGITADQPIEHSEFGPAGAAHRSLRAT